MKLESVVIDDDLAEAVDRLWPTSTWSECIEHALALAVADAQAADRETLPIGSTVDIDQLARAFAATDDSDDLEAGGDDAA